MEHEVLVPLPSQTLRRSLDRPELVAVCLPGFTPDEDGESPLVGRLKLRVGSTSVTYRGALRRLDAGDDPGTLLFALDGRQAVGAGSVAGTIRLRLEVDTEDPDLETRVTFLTSLQGSGRIEELSASALQSAGRRLLDRFCVDLAERADGLDERLDVAGDVMGDVMGDGDVVGDDLADLGDLGDVIGPEGTDSSEFFLVEGLGDLNDLGPLEEELSDLAALPEFSELDELSRPSGSAGDPARRHIVGRSAEEVDHAPPRGRYAPALPARSARSRASARWGNPEPRMGEPPVVPYERSRTPWLVGGGVALIGGAVILVRALRRPR